MKRLLFVDDDRLLTQSYGNQLSAHGFQVNTARGGAAALSMLRSGKPDVVVLDLMMPEVSGVDVLKHIRSEPNLADTPVVLLTNAYDSDLGQSATRIGIQKAFQKAQCNPSVLMAAIDEILDPNAAVAGPPQPEEDFFGPSGAYFCLQQNSAKSPEARAASPKPEGPGCPELKEASSLLQKGLEAILVRESELAGQCATLRAKVEELTGALAKAHADAVREIQTRDAAARDQDQQLNRVLASLARERREWHERLKSSDDSFKNVSRQLEAQQAEATALRQEMAALELDREQHEQILFEARKEMTLEREARVSAEQRAGAAEESLRTQRAELEGQIQASLGSLLARVSSKVASASIEK